MHIFESVDIVSRKGKSIWAWNGLQNLTNTFSKFQIEAVKSSKDEAIKNGVIQEEGKFDDIASSNDIIKSISYTRETSLGRLCRKFSHLFLIGHSEMSLKTACEIICRNNAGEYRTKFRRLCDIAEVVNCFGVFKKYRTVVKLLFRGHTH